VRILFLSQRVPYPPNRGDRITTYHEIRLLSRRHEVHLASLSDGDDEIEGLQPLRDLCASLDIAVVPRWRSNFQAMALAASPLPLTLPFYFSPRLAAKVAWRIATTGFDLIHVYSSSMAQYVDWCSHVPRVMQFADLDSIKWRQMSRMRSWPKSWVYASEAVRLLMYERSIAHRYQKCLVVTEEERQELMRFIPHADSAVAENGVDVEYFSPQPGEPESDHMVFVGVMDYFPNEEGVEFFCREVLPLVQRSRPEARITIVGARPSERVLALRSIPGVAVTGAVDDIRPYMASASLAVVPLRLARGVQNKVLEAMSMGMATVCTTAAFEGVRATVGEHGLVADEPAAFAEAVVSLLEAPENRRRMGAAARDVMVAQYSWETQVAKLEAVHEAAVASFRESRRT
jgi:sugar transferase (PEP-CTERM/EpsH1 system associated)